MAPNGGGGPLGDLLVLDLTVALAGPFCTLILGGLGAEVIKIESPGGGDIGRGNPPFVGRGGVHFGTPAADDMSLYMLNRARNKKSVTLDLKSERGRELFFELVERADVVVENFSTGTADRLGVGYADARERNPAIVYCSISGVGAPSPFADVKAMDVIIQALSGLMGATGERGGPPLRTGVPMGDLVGPLYAVGGILAALWQRQRTGRGDHVEIALLDGLVSLVAEEHFDVLSRHGFDLRTGNHFERLAPFGAYAVTDGHVAIAAVTDAWFAALADAMGRPDLVADERFATRGARTANAGALNALVEEWTARHTQAEVIDELYRRRHVPAVPVRDPLEMVQDASLRERGAVLALTHPTIEDIEPAYGSGMPLRFARSSTGYDRPAPMLGQHNDEVYGELLGLDGDALGALRDAGVI
jgi:formyl-CoA transferase